MQSTWRIAPGQDVSFVSSMHGQNNNEARQKKKTLHSSAHLQMLEPMYLEKGGVEVLERLLRGG